VIRTGGDRGHFEYAAALIDVNESAWKRGAGHVRQVEGSDTANWKQRNAMEARFRRCKMIAAVRWRSALVDPFELSRVGRNDTFLEDEAAIEATFAGLYRAIRFLREFIECKSLDRTHWRRAALHSVDLGLHLDLHGWNLIGLADDFHSQSGLVDKGIKWQH
jgi:hypothetical protein